MKKFEVGKTYIVPTYYDDNLNEYVKEKFKCVRRTEKYVTFEDIHGRVQRRKVINYNEAYEEIKYDCITIIKADLAADDEFIYLTSCPYYVTNGCAIYITSNKMAYTREYKQVLVKNSVNDTEKEYTALKFKRDQFKKFTAAEKSDIYEFSFDVDFNYMLEEAKQKDYILIKEL